MSYAKGMTIESDVETERSFSAEDTVEESPQKHKRRKIKMSSSRATASEMSKQTSVEHDGQYIKATKYPDLPPKSTKLYNDNSEELYCICRRPDNGELMVGCDGCDDWYHFKCMKINIKYQEMIANYYCPYCEIDGKGVTLWKRKCRVRDCFKPILDNKSKYCSKEHGLKFLSNILDKKLQAQEGYAGVLSKAQVDEMIHISDNVDKFKNLGNNMPDVPDQDFTKNSRVLNLEDSIRILKEEREIALQKRKVLTKSRENVKKLNELLSANDPSAGKKKAKKIDICGYDLIFTDPKFENKQLNEDQLASNDTEGLKEKYEKFLENETNETSFCFNDRKKCQKHNGWQSLINDEIEMNIRDIDQKIIKNEKTIEKIIKTLKMGFFEKQM